MANPKELLTHFSVTNDEAELYLALLKLGPATATEVAAKAKKQRTVTHFHLKKLIEKELVSQSKRGRMFVFNAVSPAELAERFSRMTTDFKSVVPQLEAMKRVDGEAPRVSVSESRSGYFQVYDEISSLPEGSTFYAMEGADAFRNELTLLTPDMARDFYAKMVKRGIGVKLIMTNEAVSIPNAMMDADVHELFLRRTIDARTFPEATLPFQGLTLVYSDTVAHVIPGKDIVIRIRHTDIAQSYRATFDGLFAFGKAYSFQA